MAATTPAALTVKFLDAVQPSSKCCEYPDAPIPGLAGRLRFVVHPTGAKSWIVRYRHGGKSQKLTLGSYPTVGLADARQRGRAALMAVADGSNPHAEKVTKRREKAKPPTDLMPDVIEEFVRRYVKPSYKTAVETERMLEKEVAAPWATKRLQDITGRDVIKLLDGIVDRGSPYTANRTFELIRKLMRWAVARKMIAASPCDGMTAPADEQSRDRVLSHDEIRWFWRATQELDYPFGPLFQLLLMSGQRRDEVAWMRRSEVDADGVWTLPKGRMKNDKEHVVPLPSLARDILAGLPPIVRSEELLFPATRTIGLKPKADARPVSGFSKAKDRVDALMLGYAREERGDDVQIPDWRLHDLRRTMASEMARLGQPIHVVEAVLGHKAGTIRGVAAVYNRYDYREEKARALATWVRALESIVEGRRADNVVALAG